MTDQVTFLFTGCRSELCPVGAGPGVSSRKTTGRVDSIRCSPILKLPVTGYLPRNLCICVLSSQYLCEVERVTFPLPLCR